jgi:hypothetical protein
MSKKQENLNRGLEEFSKLVNQGNLNRTLESLSELGKMVGEAKLALECNREEEKVERFLLRFFKMGRERSFTDNDGNEHEFISPSFFMHLLIKKIAFGKTYWFENVRCWVIKKIWGEKRGDARIHRIAERQNKKGKIVSRDNDREAITYYKNLHKHLLYLNAKVLGMPSVLRKIFANIYILAYIKTVK